MTGIIDNPLRAISNYYNYSAHETAASNYSALAQFSIGQTNAFAHAYLSAMMIREHSAVEAKLFGDARESLTTFQFYFSGNYGDSALNR
jgi:hypothetical protein